MEQSLNEIRNMLIGIQHETLSVKWQIAFGIASIIGLIVTAINAWMVFHLTSKFKKRTAIEYIIKQLLKIKENISSKTASTLPSDTLERIKSIIELLKCYHSPKSESSIGKIFAKIHGMTAIAQEDISYLEGAIDLIILESKVD
jgi:hypothetical protein